MIQGLRTGNYVGSGKGFYKIYAMSVPQVLAIQDYKEEMDSEGKVYPADNTILNPINLNTEWMKDFGFELFPWGYVKNEVLIRYSFNGHSTAKFWLEVGNGLRVELEFVHQLQNLYYVLKNHELSVS